MATSEPLGITTAIHADEVNPEWQTMWRRLLAPLPSELQERRPLDCESGERRSEASHKETSGDTVPHAPTRLPTTDEPLGQPKGGAA